MYENPSHWPLRGMTVRTNISQGTSCAMLKQTNGWRPRCYTRLDFKALTPATRLIKRMIIRPGEYGVASGDDYNACETDAFHGSIRPQGLH